MSWRTVVISSNAKLDYQLGYMVVRKDVTTKIHLGEIGMLMVESTSVSITAAFSKDLASLRTSFSNENSCLSSPPSDVAAANAAVFATLVLNILLHKSTDMKRLD